MYLLQINTEERVIIGISAMVLLFTSFLISFISSQRKKIQYHKDIQEAYTREQRSLTHQNELLEKRVDERTAELTEQKEALEISINNLRATQLQLVQKEKMASLGELTAGIAHEIQNPLNFVNNFSEVNNELLHEMKQYLAKENLTDAGKENIQSAIDMITENLTKIAHHGKRADDIVKGMLLHSRSSKGQKEPSDINAIAWEYFRLSYHGLRAKDKSLSAGQAGFNATMKTDFDESLSAPGGKISIIPQEIGRVLLNLFNNAFYSVTEKNKLLQQNKPADAAEQGYQPTVLLTTKRIKGAAHNDRIEVRVRDNGMGISKQVIDKIFLPFFTTKPSGQGTGLGLSLSYDIITKGHQGEMRAETKVGEFTEFIITLPANDIGA
ncbi:MAG: ATP-binding protein [Bacteroidota bacterium]|nr:ATP-binding protein [Bacteroidota bacterium]